MPEKSAAATRTMNALLKPMTPSTDLAAIVGPTPLARSAVVAKVWKYIKANGLQDAKDRRQMNADAKLRPIFGRDHCSMFEMNKHLSAHLS